MAPSIFRPSLDLEAVARLARDLRKRPCFCDSSQIPLSGSFNWVFIISFDDGVKWIFRTPRKESSGTRLPDELVSDLIASEVATMKYISQHSTIPVPSVYDYSCTTSNNVGVPYILMSQAKGTPLASWSWLNGPNPLQMHNNRETISHKAQEKVMAELGKISSQLLRLHSLNPAFYFQDRYSLSEVQHGPYLNEEVFYRSLLDTFLLHVRDLDMSHHCFRAPVPTEREFDNPEMYRRATDLWNDFVTIGLKIDSGENRFDYYAAGKALEDAIPSLATTTHPEVTECFGSGFAISHPDLSINNIFVDEDFNITSIIDWSFASTVPIPQLLVTPGMPHPRDQPSASATASFRTSFMDHLGVTSGASSVLWSHAERIWHFIRWVNMDSLIASLKYIRNLQQRSDMEQVRVELVSEDLSPEQIEDEERKYFSAVTDGRRRYNSAKKLTDKFQQSDELIINASVWSSAEWAW
ncbi:kinase-like domain-containing protein [Fusarium mundagurra]|uniref:Kinase-like domain-containing protein n=1 Tax=Fusarium mundagurra TaxID=1567541 RepID=A0A8H6CYK8_9HYPO|nr:kinase-like domain-containing protein [Fusarium mundagurra]